MELKLGTFNVNNLFDRFNFEAEIGAMPSDARNVKTEYRWVLVGGGTDPDDPPPQIDPTESTSPYYRIQRSTDGTLIKPKSEEGLKSIGDRIDAMDLDLVCVQEVENLDALRAFNRSELNRSFKYEVLVEGNDPRFIDVGILSHNPIANVTSHRFEVHDDDPNIPIFGRDLLQADVLTPSRSRKLLTVFVNHLKSNFVRFDDPNPDQTRQRNHARRRRQSEVVHRVVEAQTRPDSRYVVLGDMNDSPESDTLAPFAQPLVDALEHVVESQPPPGSTNPEDAPTNVRWTHRFSVSRAPDKFELLDQIWLSPALGPKLDHAEIERRAKWTSTAAGVGSDHDPVWIRLTDL